MMLERLTLRQNGQVGSKKHKFNGKCFTPTHFVLMFLYSLHSVIQVGLTFKSNPSISKFNFICQVYVHVYGVLHHFQQDFSYIVEVNIIGGEHHRPATDKLLSHNIV